MPLQATSGAASYDAFGGGVPVVPAYIEEVFGTYLYTGNDTVQTITNGIDLSTKGGAVFIKSRNLTSPTVVYDTNRGINKALCTNLTNAENVGTLGTNQDLNSFNTNGFAVNLFTNAGGGFGINNSAHNLASWTFRKQPKFFDVVTYTGNGTAGRQIAHSLGSTPGFLVVKNTATSGTDWNCWHRSIPTSFTVLNATYAANAAGAAYFGNGSTAISPTSTVFTVSDALDVNASGQTYVAYLFAHNAGGFGLTGTDNVVSCGSYTGNGSTTGPVVTLGYEVQFVMIKRATGGAGSWLMHDVMRGMSVGGNTLTLYANLSLAEQDAGVSRVQPTATGFQIANTATSDLNTNGSDYIYIAIRRGPMKVPTTGTSVFSPVARAGTSATATVTAGFPVDMTIIQDRTQNSFAAPFDRLRGATNRLFTPFTAAEASEPTTLTSFAVQDGFTLGTDLGAGFVNTSGDNYINWNFRRAPSFFDEVCWSSTGSAQTLNHNLGVVPELMIRKVRNGTWEGWMVYAAPIGNTKILYLNQTAAEDTNNGWNNQTPTATQFFVNNTLSNYTMVTYLFATCAGVSKVGSYTGTGTTKQIDCGFTSGARFVLIKRTDSTGSWYVWDVARGISSGNDPYLLLNSTAAEVTNTDYIDAYSAGFEISSTAPAEINASGGSFIFLAIS